MIKFGSISLISALLLAGITINPAQAETSDVARLVRHADGTLEVVTGTSFGVGKSLAHDQVLAVQTEEVPTYVEPLEASPRLPVTKQGGSSTSYNQWGLDYLQARSVWNTTKGEGITVAVLDTGINIDHQDFAGRAHRGYTALGASTGDLHGHGTHVAGVIAAEADNQFAIDGVAPGVEIWEGKITNDTGVGTSTWMAEGIVAAINAGVDVINISMTSDQPMPLVHEAIKQAVSMGIPVVGSAGNEKKKGSPTRYPAAYPEVIAVGAIRQEGDWAVFSNTNDYIDVTAPGNFIAGLFRTGGVIYMSGTSQAAPMVSGSLALMKSANPTASVTELTEAITSTATGEYHTINLLEAFRKVTPGDSLDQAPMEEYDSLGEEGQEAEAPAEEPVDEMQPPVSEESPAAPLAPTPQPPATSDPLTPRAPAPAPARPAPAPAPRLPGTQPGMPPAAGPALPNPPAATKPQPLPGGAKPISRLQMQLEMRRDPNAPIPVAPVFHYGRPVR